jgi:hypothetical protein
MSDRDGGQRTQQHGLFHEGAVASLVDVACGYAALSVMPSDREVLTVEFKVHFLNPAMTDQGERYNLLTINGKPTKKSFKEIGGIQSDAEFGSILQWIFQPESQTRFQSEHPTDLRGRPTLVFSYFIEQDHSKFEVNSGNRFHMIAAFGGLVYVDRETNRVLKITAVPSGIPASWPITAASQELDYGFAEISGQKFFLPLHAQLNITTQDGSQARNEIEFGNYRKFTTEATLKFEP